jgi:hypothetical protein
MYLDENEQPDKCAWVYIGSLREYDSEETTVKDEEEPTQCAYDRGHHG